MKPLAINDLILVRCGVGFDRTQLAQVMAIGPRFRVRKWSNRGRRWSAPVLLDLEDVRGPAPDDQRTATVRAALATEAG